MPTSTSDRSRDLTALTLVMEGKLALDDAVRVLMAVEQIDREHALDAVVRAAAFASTRYGGRPLDRHVLQVL
jgi:hypothetical protein